jgi:Rrf2 family transcriptional regulator, iron-sulfur cluster assembly transcription factor
MEIMRLTRAGEYAIRCITYLSKKGVGVFAKKLEISQNAEIPAGFLAKIVQDLGKAGLLEIKQGSKGGYCLIRDPREITLLEVVEIMIGRIYLNDCVVRPKRCPSNPRCKVHRVWDDASSQLRENLANTNFAHLIEEDYCVSGDLQLRNFNVAT